MTKQKNFIRRVMVENSNEEDIKMLEKLDYLLDDVYSTGLVNDGERNKYQYAIEHILSDYKRVLKENEEYKNAINVVNKEKADWIRAYQEEKDKQFDFINKISSNDSIPVQKVKDKISERQFELQQEYKNFEDDAILIVLQKLLEGRE